MVCSNTLCNVTLKYIERSRINKISNFCCYIILFFESYTREHKKEEQ